MLEEKFLKLLSDELVVALGCTEPSAIALAAATARKYFKGDTLDKISVFASANIIKNAMNVKIAGTDRCGISLAAAIGALKGKSENGLEIFKDLDPDTVSKADELIRGGKVFVDIAKTNETLYIMVVIEGGGNISKAVVEKTHTDVSLVEVDGRLISKTINEESVENTDFTSIESIWDFVESVDIKKLGLIKQAIELNRAIGEEGLKNAYGLQVGRIVLNEIGKGTIEDSFTNRAAALAAAGCDARMAGSLLKVMSNSGSGNQGIVSTLPVLAVWEKLGLSKETLIRAVTLSNLITIHIKLRFGRISALCGATIAAAGASCGIAYLLGGEINEIKAAIQNIAGNLTGMLCDGAKAGCALKVYTCTSAAVLSALMAIRGISIKSTDGIIEDNLENTINNICTLSNKGTSDADAIILSILLNKENSN